MWEAILGYMKPIKAEGREGMREGQKERREEKKEEGKEGRNHKRGRGSQGGIGTKERKKGKNFNS